jgi:hypothetical protein
MDECFVKDSKVLVPAKLISPEEIEPGAVVRLSTLVQFLEKSPAKNLLVAVHDNDEQHVKLRYENLKAFLTDGNAWFEHSRDNAQDQDKQMFLKWISTIRNWNCDPGKVDNIAGNNYKTAKDNYRQNYGTTTGDWPWWQDGGDFVAWHDMFYTGITEILNRESTPSLFSNISFCDPEYMICGEDRQPDAARLKLKKAPVQMPPTRVTVSRDAPKDYLSG